MRLSEFDYDLPDRLIAQTPLSDRSASRLLHLHRNEPKLEHKSFTDIVNILQAGDLLVINDTLVTARRLLGHRVTGAEVEALVLRKIGDEHEALMRPAKKLKQDERIDFQQGLIGVIGQDLGGGLKRIRFESASEIEAAIFNAGKVPLPPYIRRPLNDEGRYQTIYGSSPGSAAAPTAGLHFTSQILKELAVKGVKTARVTLDVGIDTFRPVSAATIEEHKIHGETCSVSEEASEAVADCKGRIIAVGTTSARTLEMMASTKRQIRPGVEHSKLFITPGYEFLVVDGILTNFHMPRTTMLFMVAALVGKGRLMNAYAEAVNDEYRFLSFGDSMLVL